VRNSAAIVFSAWCLSCSYVGPRRIEPLALCGSVMPDSTWKAVPVGNQFSVLVPGNMEHPRGMDRLGPIPNSQAWSGSYLALWWDTVAFAPPGRRTADSLPPTLQEPYTAPAAAACSAPSPRGWTAITYIWTDRDMPYRERQMYVARVFIVPVDHGQPEIDLMVVALSRATLGDALAIVRSLGVAPRR